MALFTLIKNHYIVLDYTTLRKLIVIFLLPVFLVSTTIGVTMTSLYCNGKLTKTGMNVKACCNKVNKGGCCKTEIKLVKVEDIFLKTSNSFDLSNIFTLYYSSGYISCTAEVKPLSQFRHYSHKAPPLDAKPLYILFHSLVI
jgi:hypothetical protein